MSTYDYAALRKSFRLTPEEREALRDAVLRVVEETYRSWLNTDSRWRGKEPRVTSGYVVDFLAQASYGQPEKYEDKQKADRRNLVASALRTLKLAEKVVSTIGADDNGREIRCWEPWYLTHGLSHSTAGQV